MANMSPSTSSPTAITTYRGSKSSSCNTRARMQTTNAEHSTVLTMHGHDYIPTTKLGRQKRVWKACGRCRVKKTKCDGETPCKRCKDDGCVCTTGSSKKAESRQLSLGYAEVLENTQHALVATVQKLYAMLRSNEPWRLEEPGLDSRGLPVVHDIAHMLGCIRASTDFKSAFQEEVVESTTDESFQQHEDDSDGRVRSRSYSLESTDYSKQHNKRARTSSEQSQSSPTIKPDSWSESSISPFRPQPLHILPDDTPQYTRPVATNMPRITTAEELDDTGMCQMTNLSFKDVVAAQYQQSFILSLPQKPILLPLVLHTENALDTVSEQRHDVLIPPSILDTTTAHYQQYLQQETHRIAPALSDMISIPSLAVDELGLIDASDAFTQDVILAPNTLATAPCNVLEYGVMEVPDCDVVESMTRSALLPG